MLAYAALGFGSRGVYQTQVWVALKKVQEPLTWAYELTSRSTLQALQAMNADFCAQASNTFVISKRIKND